MSGPFANSVAALPEGLLIPSLDQRLSSLLFALSIFLGVLSVANKLLLLANRRSGWTSGMVIGLLSSIYFYSIGFSILAFAELGFFVVMLYGYFSNKKRSNFRDFLLYALLTYISVELTKALFKSELTLFELGAALSFIWGGYALAAGYRYLGWCLFLLAHITTAFVSFLAGELAFSSLQAVSGLVCLVALTSADRRHSKGQFAMKESTSR